MRTGKSLAMVLGALLMLALGFWAMGGAGEGRDELAAVAPGEERAALIEASRGPLERAPRDPVPANMPTRVDARTESTSSVAERELARPRSTNVVGEHVISGRVLDPDGQPVLDAAVHIVSRMRANDPNAWEHVAARTDADGRYRIDNSPPGRYSLVARHPMHGSGSERHVRVEKNGATKVEAPDIHLHHRGAIVGSVLDPDQQPVEAARVRLRGRWSRSTTTDAAGTFEFLDIPEGEYHLIVDAEEFIEEHRERVPSGSYGLRLALTRRIAVEVTVLDGSTRDPIPRYRAEVWAIHPKKGILGRRVDVPRHVNDEEGKLRIEDLDMGSYVVRVEADGFARSESSPFQLQSGVEEPTYTLLLQPGGAFAGRVLDSVTEEPISLARVRLRHIDVHGRWREFEALKTRFAGEFRCDHLGPGVYRVHIYHPDYATPEAEDVVVSAGAAAPLTREFRLVSGASLEGKIGPTGNHASSVSLHAEGRTAGRTAVASHGLSRYRFEQLLPGNYRLTVTRDARGKTSEVVAEEVRLELGEHRVLDIQFED